MTSNHLARIAAALLLCLLPATAFAAWSADRIALSTESGYQWYPSVVSDGLGGAILVWQDYRAGNGDLYAQRVTSAGDPGWGDAGLAVCDDAGQQEFFRQVVPDGAGGVIVIWMDGRGGGLDVYAQRIDGAGNVLWAPNGVAVSNGADDDFFPLVVADGTGGALVAWQAGLGDEGDICVRRVGADGELDWDDCVLVRDGGSPRVPVMVPDGEGGAVLGWIEDGLGSGAIVSQRVDGSGVLRWAGGAAVCVSGDVRSFVDVCSDGLGGAVFVWHDLRNGNYDIYAQRLDANGASMWTDGGQPVCLAPNDQWFPRVVRTGDDAVVIAWTDLRNADNDVYAQRVTLAGTVSWSGNGLAVSSAAGHQVNPRLIHDGNGGACVAWQDRRSGEYDIYAQRIDAAGAPVWDAAGVAVCDAPGDQRLPELGPDGTGGAIIAWECGETDSDVYCTRVTADGDFVATAVAAWAAAPDDGAILVTWVLSAGSDHPDFAVSRREEPAGDWAERPDILIDYEAGEYVLRDDDVQPGRSYVYRLEAIEDGERALLFETGAVRLPAAPFALHQNTPNPFNPVTTIRFSLAASGRVRLVVYDAAGRRIKTLVDAVRRAGDHAVEWRGRDDRGARVDSGVYFAVLAAEKTRRSMKMVLLR